MTQIWYWLIVLTVYLGAARDYYKLPVRRRTSQQRAAFPFIVGLLTFHSIFGMVFLFNGDIGRGGGPMVWYITNSMILLFLIPTGTSWTVLGRGRVWPFFRGRLKNKDVFEFLLLLIVPITISGIMFRLIPWKVNAAFQAAMNEGKHSTIQNSVLMFYLLISAPIAEEFILRHYLLGRMVAAAHHTRRKIATVAAIVFTSAVFAMGHGSMIDPEWLKYAQVFMFGCALGITQRRLGIECAIMMHLVFNISAFVAGMAR